jgi:glycerol-3-phosphate acyltransferase PlsY
VIVLFVLAGYLAGSIPTGYWLVPALRGEDIRKAGSGNIGATNVWRTHGAGSGLPFFAGAAALAVLVLHRANIARLRAGTETRFRFSRPATG